MNPDVPFSVCSALVRTNEDEKITVSKDGDYPPSITEFWVYILRVFSLFNLSHIAIHPPKPGHSPTFFPKRSKGRQNNHKTLTCSSNCDPPGIIFVNHRVLPSSNTRPLKAPPKPPTCDQNLPIITKIDDRHNKYNFLIPRRAKPKKFFEYKTSFFPRNNVSWSLFKAKIKGNGAIIGKRLSKVLVTRRKEPRNDKSFGNCTSLTRKNSIFFGQNREHSTALNKNTFHYRHEHVIYELLKGFREIKNFYNGATKILIDHKDESPVSSNDITADLPFHVVPPLLITSSQKTESGTVENSYETCSENVTVGINSDSGIVINRHSEDGESNEKEKYSEKSENDGNIIDGKVKGKVFESQYVTHFPGKKGLSQREKLKTRDDLYVCTNVNSKFMNDRNENEATLLIDDKQFINHDDLCKYHSVSILSLKIKHIFKTICICVRCISPFFPCRSFATDACFF